MALSQVLELTSGPAIVPLLGYTSPLTATVNAMRGSVPVAVQVASAGIPTALPTGAELFYGVKLESALKDDWLAKCQLTASTDPALPGMWTGTLLLNTPEMRAAMHAELTDPIPELLTLDCLAEVYYTIPGQVDPVFGLNFDFSVGAPLYNGTEGMAPSPNPPFPPVPNLVTVDPATHALTSPSATAFYAANPPPGGGASAVVYHPVTDAQRLALTGIPVGYRVMVTDQGNRLEEFLGDFSDDDTSINNNNNRINDNWLVLRNAIALTIEYLSLGEEGDDLTSIGGQAIYSGATVYLGYAYADAVPLDGAQVYLQNVGREYSSNYWTGADAGNGGLGIVHNSGNIQWPITFDRNEQVHLSVGFSGG